MTNSPVTSMPAGISRTTPGSSASPRKQEIASYEEHLANKKIVPAEEEKKVQPQADRVRSVRMPAISFPRRLMWVMPAILVLLVAVALVQYRYGGNAGVPRKASPEAPVSAPVKTDESVAQQGGEQAPLKPSPEGPVASERETRKDGHNLDIVATDAVWLQVVIDNADKREMQLQPGERVSLSARESFALKIGNAGGVKLKFDGRDFENLGQKGQVIRLHLPEAVPQGITTGQNRSIITPAEASSQTMLRQQ